MQPKGKTQRKRHSKSPEGKQIARQEQGIDYGKLRDTIVEANKIIEKNVETDRRKSMERDHLTKLLTELLNGLFVFAVMVLAVLSVGMVVQSFSRAQGRATTIFTIVSWIVFVLLLAGFIVVDYYRKKKPKEKKAWIKPITWGILVVIATLFLVVFIKDIELLASMLMTAFFIMGMAFCRLAIKALRYETDRAYLVAYFSAITGIAALVVSVAALVISSK